MTYEDKQELADKVEWEGGLTDAILDYGISAVDLPADTPAYIREAWGRIQDVSSDVDLITEWLAS